MKSLFPTWLLFSPLFLGFLVGKTHSHYSHPPTPQEPKKATSPQKQERKTKKVTAPPKKKSITHSVKMHPKIILPLLAISLGMTISWLTVSPQNHLKNESPTHLVKSEPITFLDSDGEYESRSQDENKKKKKVPWYPKFQAKYFVVPAPTFSDWRTRKTANYIEENNNDPNYPYHTYLFRTKMKNGNALQGYAMYQKTSSMPERAILHFIGNAEFHRAENKHGTTTPERYQALLQAGYVLFQFDYPGRGSSQGSIAYDEDIETYAEACYEYVKKRFPTIILAGKSLGGYPATHVARKYRNDHKIKKLILDATFHTLAVFRGEENSSYFKKTLFLKMNNAKNLQTLSKSAPPFSITIIHGHQDKTILYENMKKFKAQFGKNKNFFFYSHEGHHYEEHEDQRLALVIQHKPKKGNTYNLSFGEVSKQWKLGN